MYDEQTLKDEIAAQEAQITRLEAEIIELEHEIAEFKGRYDQAVGFAETRVQAARQALSEMQRADAYTPAGGASPSYFSDVEEQFRQRWSSVSAASPEPPSEARDGALKRLYRALARQFHPDFGVDAEDRERRTHLMAIINDAYERGDLETLEVLEDPSSAVETKNGAPNQPLMMLTLRGLQQTRARLSSQIDTLQERRSELLNGEWLKLKLDEKLLRFKGRDLFAETIANLNREYDECMAQIARRTR